jgi:hypothetical protein
MRDDERASTASELTASEQTASEPDVSETITAESIASESTDSESAAAESITADETLLAAVDVARAALIQITPADTIGEPVGHIVEDEHVLSLLFDCLMTGYPGWHWTVTLSRIDQDAAPTVLETELMPGNDALLAPEWVPWSDRLAEHRTAQELAAAEEALEGADEDADDIDDEDDDESDESDDFDDDDDDDDSEDDDDSDDDDAEDALDEDALDHDDFGDDGDDALDGIDFETAADGLLNPADALADAANDAELTSTELNPGQTA